jgi:hypothetical protein
MGHVLSGSGTSSDLTGIPNRSGLQAPQASGTENNLDAIYRQIVNIRTNALLRPRRPRAGSAEVSAAR